MSVPLRQSAQCMQAVAAALFDVPVGVAVRDLRASAPPLITGEGPLSARTTAARRAEFAAGRAAVREAMAALGGAPMAIPQGADRAPVWPAGWQGSLSHSAALCVAAVTQAPVTLGIDVELLHPLPEDIMATICSEKELSHIQGPHRALHATLVFSAKELAYKAQYSLTGSLLEFHDFEVLLDLPHRRFSATFRRPVGPFAAGDTLPGRFDCAKDHLVTAVTIEQARGEGV